MKTRTSAHPLINSYSDRTGAFRTRSIRWSGDSWLSLNPYTAGIMAYFCVKYANFAPMMTGGMSDMNQQFTPPDELLDTFRRAYALVERRGKWLAWAEDPKSSVMHTWVEYSPKSIKSPKVLWNEGLDEWEDYFVQTNSEMEDIHAAWTLIGIPESRWIRLPLNEWSDHMDALSEEQRQNVQFNMRRNAQQGGAI